MHPMSVSFISKKYWGAENDLKFMGSWGVGWCLGIQNSREWGSLEKKGNRVQNLLRADPFKKVMGG